MEAHWTDTRVVLKLQNYENTLSNLSNWTDTRVVLKHNILILGKDKPTYWTDTRVVLKRPGGYGAVLWAILNWYKSCIETLLRKFLVVHLLLLNWYKSCIETR